jgi:hypothetical protein
LFILFVLPLTPSRVVVTPYQKVPKGTKRYQKVPKGTKRFQKVPKGSKRLRVRYAAPLAEGGEGKEGGAIELKGSTSTINKHMDINT